MASKCTLHDLADHLGISKFAVSRALTGKSGVSDDTRQSVIKAADRFGYVARGLRTARTIEVLFQGRDSANREMWIDVQHGINAEAARQRLQMTVRWTAHPEILKRVAGETAGIILIGPQSDAMLDATHKSNVPAVQIGLALPALSTLDGVTCANEEVGVFAAEYLHRLGHRHMVYVHGRVGYQGRKQRLRGFADTIAGLANTRLKEIAFQNDDRAFDFRDALLALCGDAFMPTAVVCGNDYVAVTELSELHRMGLAVPQDISVFGLVDYPIATQVVPNLTTIRMPHRQMGVAAVRQLLARRAVGPGDDLPPVRISLDPQFVERHSIAAVTQINWLERQRASSRG